MRDESVFDELKEECGVFGIVGHPEAARLTYYGLHALQHRGQESAGIAATDGRAFRHHRGMGLVTEVFDDDVLRRLSGHTAIGHVRYSTTGESGLAQRPAPGVQLSVSGQLALATNGNLVNAGRLRQELERAGSIFQTTTDTEVIAHLIARSRRERLEDAVNDALAQLTGAFALLILTKDRLLVAQDPHGLRPLSIGRLGDAHVFSSETCAFDAIGAELIREVQPGELIVLDRSRACGAEPSLRRPGGRSVPSNISTSPGPTAKSEASTCTRPGSGWGGSWPRKPPPKRTW